jgi:hypothetical protein
MVRPAGRAPHQRQRRHLVRQCHQGKLRLLLSAELQLPTLVLQRRIEQRRTRQGNPGHIPSSTFPGVASGLQFPLAAPGTLADSDRNTAVAKGVTLESRNGTSTAILQPALNASGALPTESEPL